MNDLNHMTGDLISIVVPVYKVEEYLGKCLDALKNQTYCNIEVVLVDDGSPDNCGVMCDDVALSDSRFKVFHKTNGGLADARNYGLDRISGDYVTFVDSDDYVAFDYVERLINMIHEDGSDISICGVAGFSLDDNGDEVFHKILCSGDHTTLAADNALAKMLRQNGFDTEAWGKMYRVSLFDEVRYPVGVYNEDLPTTYKCFLKAHKVSFTEDKLYYYLQRAGSIMGNNRNVKRYWDAFNNAQLLLEDIEKERPGLIDAVNSRVLSVYFQSFAGADLCDDNRLKAACWEKIIKIRLKVLFDPRGRTKARAASFLSLFGQEAFLKA